MRKKTKRVLALLLVFAMVLGLGAPSFAAPNNGNNNGSGGNGGKNVDASVAPRPIYLKGSGREFKWDGWQNIFYVGGATKEDNKASLNGWHLVYSGDVFSAIVSMQVTFTNGAVFNWVPDMQPSVNGGGNNMGWIIYAPKDWEIAYVNKGNNNQSPSFLTTTEAGNPQFNISGFNKGSGGGGGFDGALTLEKFADGKNIIEWLNENHPDEVGEILDGMTFDLYKVDGDNVPYTDGNFIASEQVGIFGAVVFSELKEDGWYVVVEKLQGRAAEVFAAPTPLYVQLAFNETTKEAIILQSSGGNKSVAFDDGTVFDFDAKYMIVNGYNSPKHVAGLGYPGLNNGGDLFYIGVKNGEKEYPSFCAHGGSRAFAGESGMGCAGYLVVEKAGMDKLANTEMAASYDAILSALNWIEDNVGSLKDKGGTYGLVSSQRVVAQTVIWALLGNINVDSEAFASTNLTDAEREFVLNALDASKTGYKGSGKIVDLVYMVCEGHHGFNDCQPQLVPLYGGRVVIENKTTPLGK